MLRSATTALFKFVTSQTENIEKYIPSSFPYDVLCLIIEHVDRNTLRVVSLLNKDCHYIATQRLWNDVTIHISFSPRHDQGPTMSLLDIITAQPARARRIRQLTISITGLSRSLEDHRCHQAQWTSLVAKRVTLALQNAILLTSLRLKPLYFGSELAQTLGMASFPFRLVALESPLETMHDLVPFLYNQPSIKHWSITDAYIKTQSARLPPDVLPNLESVHTTPPHLATVASGRPVRTLDLTGTTLRASYAGYLDAQIIGSTSRLLRLKVSLDAISRDGSQKDDITRLAILPSVIPHLQRLDVRCVLTFSAMTSASKVPSGFSGAKVRAACPRALYDALDRFARTLGLFRELKELEWTTTSRSSHIDVPRCGRWDFVDMCYRECPTLERIVINGDLMNSARRENVEY